MLKSKRFSGAIMKPKLGFLSLTLCILYFQGRLCNNDCPSDDPDCTAVQKLPKDESVTKIVKEPKVLKEPKVIKEPKELKDKHEMQKDGNGAYVYSGGTSWEDWWTYDGISGPDFWGLLNLEWSLCNKGRRQSPVNIDPASLLYDPSLRPIHVDKIRVNGVISNTGHGVIFRTSAANHGEILNITGGPLSYKYRFSEIHIHFARSDEKGSEHIIAGAQFPAELQLYGYNSDLYSNITEAMSLQKNQGLVGISILLQVSSTGDSSNPELRIITSQLHKIVHRGQEAPLKFLSLRDLMPDTPYYMTYEGSTTMPGCYETVTWIIMNKPIYITKQQLFALRRLMQGDEQNPKAPLYDNFRPTLDLNQRSIRTNIDFNRKPGSECPSMSRQMHYQANSDFQKGP